MLAGAPVWIDAAVAELGERFNNQVNTSKDNFQVKLKRQLAKASSIVSKLAAEMLWVTSTAQRGPIEG